MKDLSAYQGYGLATQHVKNMVDSLTSLLSSEHDVITERVRYDNGRGLGFFVSRRGKKDKEVFLSYDYKTRLFDLIIYGDKSEVVEGQHTLEQAIVIIKMEV